jgi:hypothetical protein
MEMMALLQVNLSTPQEGHITTAEGRVSSHNVVRRIFPVREENSRASSFVTRLMYTCPTWETISDDGSHYTFGKLLVFAFTCLWTLRVECVKRSKKEKDRRISQGSKWTAYYTKFINEYTAFLCITVVEGPHSNIRPGLKLRDYVKADATYTYIICAIMKMARLCFPNLFNLDLVLKSEPYKFLKVLKQRIRDNGIYSMQWIEDMLAGDHSPLEEEKECLKGLFFVMLRVVVLCNSSIGWPKFDILRGTTNGVPKLKSKYCNVSEEELQKYYNVAQLGVSPKWTETATTTRKTFYASRLWFGPKFQGDYDGGDYITGDDADII